MRGLTISGLIVRLESADDQEEIALVVERAFQRSDEAKLVGRLREQAAPLLSLVAEAEGRVIGHVAFSPVTLASSPESSDLCALGPLAVDPSFARRGTGEFLTRAGLSRAPELGWRAVFVLGAPAYYGRFGFRPARDLHFEYGTPALERAFQVRELAPRALAGRKGRVTYHPAFAGL
jgi:putative acetyltransferase